MRVRDVPPFSSVEIRPLPVTPSFFEVSLSALHAGGPGSAGEYSLSVKIFFGVPGSADDLTATAKCMRIKKRLRKLFAAAAQESAFEPFVSRLGGLADFRDTLLFICHASEDKPFVDSLCSFLDSSEIPVWYDRREIKIGDSVVERISDALGVASHLVVVLSEASVGKPWVRKEFSAALMKQLQDASIRVLPVLVSDCQIPPLIADLRYADCRTDSMRGFRELISAVA
ncbi:MAG: toll/interleukin-1 receptor domain-containing protein [Candidatus Binatia bacterium]